MCTQKPRLLPGSFASRLLLCFVRRAKGRCSQFKCGLTFCMHALPQKPSPLAGASAGGLLRCFVRREAGGERAVAKFALFLGSEHNEPDACKFLMAALLNSRCACPEALLRGTGRRT